MDGYNLNVNMDRQDIAHYDKPFHQDSVLHHNPRNTHLRNILDLVRTEHLHKDLEYIDYLGTFVQEDTLPHNNRQVNIDLGYNTAQRHTQYQYTDLDILRFDRPIRRGSLDFYMESNIDHLYRPDHLHIPPAYSPEYILH